MVITVFAKQRRTREGKPFWAYLATLTRKDGTRQTVSVKFREAAGVPRPESCPLNIVVDKRDANLSTREYTREDTGEIIQSYTLWVSRWAQGEAYVDHSLDDYE